ncbi:MAG: hypothetical protein P0Y53_06165 [Candidatus Pseudobacter hemicellulosilyticus]|uniref:Uncharacterized protein n=1 Tax=Candidatus Pseudobacter hemicellulosilyticus TaxID=3121375 RepID=A0AAJ5WZ69_9BACT|nr:MAG: hypothetical protein P0Y53_06165 [Pseudobacter sp.]
MATSGKIKDLPSLEKEIARLQQQAKAMEKTFDTNFDHLQDHFPRMAWNSLVRGKSGEPSVTTDLLGFLGTSLMQGALGRLVRLLSGKLVGKVLSMLGKLFK